VSFLQNHDQVGNRALGERLVTLAELHAAIAVILLAPSPPLLFMGEEFGATEPFLFFCDFEPGLAAAVTEGRRSEFARFKGFADPVARAAIPDPNALETFLQSKLDWGSLTAPSHAMWLNFYQRLLALRRQAIIPRLAGMQGGQARFHQLGERGLAVHWRLGDDAILSLLANLSAEPLCIDELWPQGEILYATEPHCPAGTRDGLPPWSVIWFLDPK
jgi:1,4-alpha-glucan branching enzyme